MSATALFMLATTVLACADVPELESMARKTEFAVQIRRTSYGIPHIVADDEKGLGFGAGYAFAQDNFCVLAEELVTVNGERSLYFGPEATYEPTRSNTRVANLPSDVYFAVLNHPGRVEAAWCNQPREVQDLITGYTQGVNRFLRESASTLPDACRGQPWVREITHGDIIRLIRRVAVETSGLRMIQAMFAAQPPKPGKQLRGRAATAPVPADNWNDADTPLGSNGIALGREATESGAGLLLAAPHFPWNGVLRFYQLHLVIPGKLDVMGATPGGLPYVTVGHNAKVAWTHTVNSSQHFTLHQLTVDPNDPTRYLVDKRWRRMTATDVEVKQRSANGTIEKIRRRVWSSDVGPIVTNATLPWTTTTAFAFGDANVENSRFIATWWAINHASSLAELRAAVENTMGIPWVQTLAVDAAGATYYGDVTPVPNLPDDPKCTLPSRMGAVVLDGSFTRCGWQVVPGTPGLGIIPAVRLPSLERTDFVQNSNDSAWLTNPKAPLTGFPAIVSRDGVSQNARTRFALTFLTSALAAGRRFTAQSLLDVAFGNHAYHAEALLADFRPLCPATGLTAQCALLDRWDRTANLESVGWPMYRAWRTALDNAAAAASPPIDTWRVPFNPADPLHTPRGLRVTDPAVATLARNALPQAVATLAALGIDPTRPWGQLQQTRRGDQVIPVHGGGGDLAGGASIDLSNDIYNKINSRPVEGRLEPFFGTSLVLAISFEGGTPSAQGLLTHSASSDPASPHRADQTELFSRRGWFRLPFTEESIQRDPNLSVIELAE